MTTTHTANRDFVDSPIARILALVLAIAIAAFLFVKWGDDIKQVVSGEPQASALPAGLNSGDATAAVNPELAACLEKRIGDVDKMKADGVLSDAQYANFKSRAESLCRQTASQ